MSSSPTMSSPRPSRRTDEGQGPRHQDPQRVPSIWGCVSRLGLPKYDLSMPRTVRWAIQHILQFPSHGPSRFNLGEPLLYALVSRSMKVTAIAAWCYDTLRAAAPFERPR